MEAYLKNKWLRKEIFMKTDFEDTLQERAAVEVLKKRFGGLFRRGKQDGTPPWQCSSEVVFSVDDETLNVTFKVDLKEDAPVVRTSDKGPSPSRITTPSLACNRVASEAGVPRLDIRIETNPAAVIDAIGQRHVSGMADFDISVEAYHRSSSVSRDALLCLPSSRNMRATGNSGLLAFCAEVAERHGGLVESHADHAVMVLPPDLASALNLPEEATIGENGISIVHGSPILAKFIQVATSEVPIVYGKLAIPYLKKSGFQEILDRGIHFVSGRTDISGTTESVNPYTVTIYRYVAVSAERTEGLVAVTTEDSSGSVIEGFEEFRDRYSVSEFSGGTIPTDFQTPAALGVEQSAQRSEVMVREQLKEFLSSMQSRLERDVKDTHKYYAAMEEDLRTRPVPAKKGRTQKKKRQRRLAALPDEMLAKISDLRQRYSVRVSIDARGALRLLVPVVRILLTVNYRGLKRSVAVVWNPVSQGLDPVPCEQCGRGSRTLYSVARGSELKILCELCVRDKKSR